MSKTDVVHIPHKARAPSNSVLSGNVQMSSTSRHATMTELPRPVTCGRWRNHRLDAQSADAGSADGGRNRARLRGYHLLGVMAPKDTPKDVIAYLNSAINKVIDCPR